MASYMGAYFKELDPFMPSYYTQSTSTNTWNLWINQTTASTSSTIWSSWVSELGTYQNVIRARPQGPQVATYYGEPVSSDQPRVHTAAELEAMERMWQSDRAEMRRRNERTAAALKRAEGLLMKYLTPDQLLEYAASKSFVVCAKSGTRYRIKSGIVGNVIQLNEEGKAVKRLCAHVPYGEVPDPDNHLTQMFMLRHHEADFLRVANVHPLH